MNKKIVNWMDDVFYPNNKNNWDDKLLREEILKIENKEGLILLDVGAGAGIVKYMNFKGVFKKVIGIDPDERVKENPYLDEGYVGLADNMPFFEDEFFDVVISDNVFEHVDNPDLFFKEIYRVVKPRGVLIAKTPKKYHYMPLIAAYTPTWFHKFYNKLRGREPDDTFPTRYLLNSKTDQMMIAKRHGFSVEKIQAYEKRPEYLRILFLTYLIGVIYERVVNWLNMDKIKILLISTFKRR